MNYLVIIFNDGKYALRCEFEEMLRECGDLLEVEGNSLVRLMFHSVLMIDGCCGIGLL